MEITVIVLAAPEVYGIAIALGAGITAGLNVGLYINDAIESDTEDELYSNIEKAGINLLTIGSAGKVNKLLSIDSKFKSRFTYIRCRGQKPQGASRLVIFAQRSVWTSSLVHPDFRAKCTCDFIAWHF